MKFVDNWEIISDTEAHLQAVNKLYNAIELEYSLKHKRWTVYFIGSDVEDLWKCYKIYNEEYFIYGNMEFAIQFVDIFLKRCGKLLSFT